MALEKPTAAKTKWVSNIDNDAKTWNKLPICLYLYIESSHQMCHTFLLILLIVQKQQQKNTIDNVALFIVYEIFSFELIWNGC